MATAKKKSAGKKTAAKKGGASKGGARGGAGKTAAKKGATKKAAAKKGGAAKGASKSAGAKKAGAKKSATKRAPNPSFMKAMRPSPQLASVVGEQPMPRTEVIKRLWDYIRKNNLQDSANKRAINADDKLRPLFGKNQVTMFDLAKIANKNLSEA